MTTGKESIHVIEFLGKKSDWESWWYKFLSWGKKKGYKKLLARAGSTIGVANVPSQDKFEKSLQVIQS